MSDPQKERAAEQSGIPDQTEGVALTSAMGADVRSITKAWQQVFAEAAAHPMLLWEMGQKLQADLLNVWTGNSEIEMPADARFEDEGWTENPLFNRMRQSYVAWTNTMDQWLDKSGLEGLERQRARFVMDAAKDVLAPVNQPFTPETIKKARETGGQSLVKGVQNFIDDLQNNHGYPAVADRDAFELGKEVAATPGAVIFRNDLFELIQYQPTTQEVHKKPLLYVFSQVNRFYLGDLTPDRSLFKQLLEEGIQVFAISWKNPEAKHANWSLDTYAEGVIHAIEVVRSVTGQKKTDVIGLCAGGTTATAAAGVLNERGENWINSLSLFVSILDNRPGDSDFTLFVNDQSVEAQKQSVRRQGMMRERDILEMFAMLRLDESILSFIRSNYFRGEDPLAHPLLYWSMDYTRVPAEMQCDFIDMSHKNSLPKKELKLLGHRIDLSKIEYPVYIMAGSTDHITPWKGCYRSTRLFGGETQFVLTSQNHTQTISARPDNRHLRYWMGPSLPEDPDDWMAEVTETPGNWRNHWIDWLKTHSKQKDAPKKLGSKSFKPMEPAPGLYVSES